MQIITKAVWQHISKRAKENKERLVAVAYLGTNASRYLRLDRGDILVVDASENCIKSGNTNPFELEKYLSKGVEVYSYTNLHAKVFVFGNISLVGSANVSGNSAKVLTECMVEFKNPASVSAAKGFIRSLALEPLTPDYIKHLFTIYKPPKIKGKGKNKSNRVQPVSCIWVQKIQDYEYTDSEQVAHNIGEEQAIKLVADSIKYKVDSIRHKSNTTFVRNAKVGDMIIQVYEGKTYPPSRILGFEKSKDDESTIILFEEPKSPKTITESKFLKKMEDIGHKNKYRKFSKQHQKNMILGLWGSFHKSA